MMDERRLQQHRNTGRRGRRRYGILPRNNLLGDIEFESQVKLTGPCGWYTSPDFILVRVAGSPVLCMRTCTPDSTPFAGRGIGASAGPSRIGSTWFLPGARSIDSMWRHGKHRQPPRASGSPETRQSSVRALMI